MATTGQLFDSEREYARWRQHPDRGMSASGVEAHVRNREAFYGTEAAIRETVEEFVDLGCLGFMVYCNSAPRLEDLQHLKPLSAAGKDSPMDGALHVDRRQTNGDACND